MTIPAWGGVSFTSTAQKIRRIVDAYPGNKSKFYITSSYRAHTPGSHHGGRLSYGGSPTAAVDYGYHWYNDYNGGNGLARWLRNFRSNIVELIHTPSNTYIKNGRNVGPYSVALHRDHIHIAMSSAQADRVLRRLGKSVPTAGSGGGSSGVRSVGSQQKEVNLAGYTPKLKQDGVMGAKTRAGVKWYQKKLGVTADGTWGAKTEAAHKKRKGGGSSSKPTGNFGPAGSVRSVGSQQKEVNLAGYTPKLKQDSKWGPKTEAAVKWYQRKIGVTADGTWGRNTDAAHKKYKAKGSSKPATGNRGKASPQLKVDGLMGPATVKALQKNLGVKVDGLMGPDTVKALQKRVGAKQDGLVGPDTYRKLQQYLNKVL